MKAALIVDDGERRGALAGARQLGRHGWRVGIAATGGARGFTSRSRYVDAIHDVPRLADGLEPFLAGVAAACDVGDYDLVFPADDPEVLALSHGRARLSAFLPYPPHEHVLTVHDKVAIAATADRFGVHVPATLLPDEFDASRPGRWIVKTRLQWDPQTSPVPRRWQTREVPDGSAAREAIDDLVADGAEPFVQARVEGGLLALTMVLGPDGEVAAAVQGAGPALTWPPGVGPRVRSTTVAVDGDLVDRVAALLRAHGWWGLADVDFIVAGDGTPYLIDINGRFHGSMAIASAAGVPMAHIWASVAQGQRTRPALHGRAGATFQWLEADLRRALVERRGGLRRDLVNTVAAAPQAAHAVFALDDPRPWVGHATDLLRRAWQQGRR